MFADDLVLLADTSEGLQQSLSVVQEYGKEWQLKIKLKLLYALKLLYLHKLIFIFMLINGN